MEVIEMEVLSENPVEVDVDFEGEFINEEKKQQAYEQGKADGFNQGSAEGYNNGYEVGRQDGYNDGFSDGYRDGEQFGINEGFQNGKTEGYQEGVTAEHSKMWDRLQLNGNLTSYTVQQGYFNGKQFGFNNFYPKYDIKPIGSATHLFYAWENNASYGVTDNNGSLKQRLEECGVVLDTSKATNLMSCFAYSRFTEIPTIDFTGITSPSNTTGVFAHSYSFLITIEKIITKESVTYKNWFNNTNITNVAFEGVIGQDLDMSYGNGITVASMKSIITHLKDYSGTDSEFTYTVRFAAARWTALEADSTAPNGDTWENYVISLGWLT